MDQSVTFFLCDFFIITFLFSTSFPILKPMFLWYCDLSSVRCQLMTGIHSGNASLGDLITVWTSQCALTPTLHAWAIWYTTVVYLVCCWQKCHYVVWDCIISSLSTVPGKELLTLLEFPMVRAIKVSLFMLMRWQALRMGPGCQWSQACNWRVGTFSPTPRLPGKGEARDTEFYH